MRDDTGAAWRVGQRVRTSPVLAAAYEGTDWHERLSRPRCGTVIEVPLATATAGRGTLRVEWDAVTPRQRDVTHWRMWVHSDLLPAADMAEVCDVV